MLFRSQPSVDVQMLKQMREELQEDGETDVVTELIDIFLEDSLKQLETMKKAINNLETEPLILAAHSLKGSCNNLGILGMSNISATLEQKGKLGLITEADQLLIELENEFVQVQSTLAKIRI